MCDCFGSESTDPEIQSTIADVNERLDGFIKSMIKDERDKQIEQKEANGGQFDANILTFPAPYSDDSVIALNIFDGDPPTGTKMYEIPKVDEYYGDISFFDDLCYYGKYSDGAFGYSFDENADPFSKDTFEDMTGSNGLQDNLDAARRYFTGMIGTPVYGVTDVKKLQNPPPPILKSKLLNDWEEVDINNLAGNKNQILSALLGDTVEGDNSDMWITLIAFTGFAAHRTTPMKADEKHPEAYFVNDTTFLSLYGVRNGYEKYGASAYFDAKYHLKEIYLSDSDTLYKAPGKDVVGAATAAQWAHAKWAWKVSASVAIFLVEYVAHSHFREANGFIKAIRDTLGVDHPLRRLLIPFTLGTVKCNRIFNEFLRENGLYHRCFAFTYKELQRLIRESMDNAPELSKGEIRKSEDRMKYRFRLFRKKVKVMSKLPDEIYPIYGDLWKFWIEALGLMTEYTNKYYGDDEAKDDLLLKDTEAAAFYAAILKNLKINEKYRLKKFNFINVITHFIANATIWNHQVSSAVSFEYSVDPDFTGLKIIGNNAKQNNVIQYAEYCLVSLSKGYNLPNLRPSTLKQDIDATKPGWQIVLADDEKLPNTKAVVSKFFRKDLEGVANYVKSQNSKRIAPYFIVDPNYLQASIKL